MSEEKKKSWFSSTFQLKGSVVPLVIGRSLLLGFFGLIVSTLYYFHFPVAQPIFGNIIPSIVLALLLVFRTNTAYERYWEGRKIWESLINTLRNLTWRIWVAVQENEPSDREGKIATLRLLPALAIAQKLYLRAEPPDKQLESWLSPSQYHCLQNTKNIPLEISAWLGAYLEQQQKTNRLQVAQLNGIETLLQNYLNSLGGCERILKTPIPLAYSIHLKQLIFLYSLTFPFQFVKDMGWWTGLFAAIVSFAVFGIEEIGLQIENPFGYDPNDLPLDEICQGIGQDVEEFIKNQNGEIKLLPTMTNLQSDQDKSAVKTLS